MTAEGITMKFTVTKESLARALSTVADATDKKAAMPILTHALFSVARGHLTVTGTDLQVTARVRIPCAGEAGTIALPAKTITEAVKSLRGEVTVSVANGRATVSAGKRRFDLATMPGEDFPAVAKVPTEHAVSLKREALAAVLGAVFPAMSTDDSRPHLAGAKVEIASGVVTAVATDGHRLTLAEHPVAPGTLSVLVPARGVALLRKLAYGDGDIVLAPSASELFATVDDVTVSARLVEAAFPQWQQVIPQDSRTTVYVDRAALLEAVRAVSLVATDKSSGVRLSFREGAVTVSVDNPDVGNGCDEVACECRGPSVDIGCNATYLCDALAAITTERARIFLAGELDPMKLTPEDSERVVAVVMPMRIGGAS